MAQPAHPVQAQLAGAVEAYRASLAAVELATREAEERKREARQVAAARRAQVHDAIVAAARAGMRQVDIIKASGYSRETVRSILRAGGVEPE